MHVYFSGIGGTSIGPLSLIAHQAGYDVSGSDKQMSNYIKYLKTKGIKNIHIGQTKESIEKAHKQKPIDWIVFSSAISMESSNHPEITFAKDHGIKTSKRDDFTNKILKDNNLKLIAVSGTHGKTTTTAMMVWLMQKLEPISYSVGAKIPFGDMGHFDPKSKYFIYECDEFDKNFLAFEPYLSIITGIDYDHHEIFPTRESYIDAFKQFLRQSEQKIVWDNDVNTNSLETDSKYTVLSDNDDLISKIRLIGEVNRRNAAQVILAANKLTSEPIELLTKYMNEFPGVSRRFEKITNNLYSDYAHTIPKIKGALQLAKEVSNDIVVVYEPLTNRRQHFIREQYKDLFKNVKKLYWVPSYLAREDPSQHIITPEEFISEIKHPKDKIASKLDNKLKESIAAHIKEGDTVVCLSGGGGGSLDEWLRSNF